GIAFGLIALPDHGARAAIVAAPLAAGAALLIAFVWQEARSPTPMMPLSLFRSRTFSGVNVLTLLLYGALGGAFFFLPFDLIQVHGYSATLAGAVFLLSVARVCGDARGRGFPAVHDHHGHTVALVGRAARPLRRAPTLDHRAGDRRARVYAAGLSDLGLVLHARLPAADRGARIRHGDHGGAVDGDGDQRGPDASDGRGVRHQQCGGLGSEPARGRNLRRRSARRLQPRTRPPARNRDAGADGAPIDR